MRMPRWGLRRSSGGGWGSPFPGGFARRAFTGVDPSQMLTSPGGLLALLWRRGDRGKNGANDGPKGQRGRAKEGGKGKGFFARLLEPEAARLVLAIFAASAAWELLRAHQGLLEEKLKHLFLTTLEVRSSQEEFAWMVDWMGRQPEGRRARNITMRPVSVVDERGAGREDGRSAFVPGYGSHFFRFKTTPMWISRRPDPAKARRPSGHFLDREDEVLVITMLTRRREVLEDFVESVKASWRAHVRRWVRVYAADRYEGWALLTERSLRPLSTLFLPPAVADVVDEVRAFLGLRELYAGLGIPWRRGYLFEGPPGTGKSSLVMALAGELRLPVYVLSLRGPGVSDDGLLQRVGLLPPRCILLIEDFENAIRAEARAGPDGEPRSTEIAKASGGDAAISLSGFLNAIDGVGSGEGRILVMTTNDAAKIPAPEAVLRPGRIDRRVVFPKIRPSEMERMRCSFEQAVHGLHAGGKDENDDAKAPGGDSGGGDSRQTGNHDSGKAATPAEYQQELLNRVYATLLQKAKSKKKNE